MRLIKAGNLILLGLTSLSFLPWPVYAVSRCDQEGYTVMTVNGVFTDEKGAAKNAQALSDVLGDQYKKESLSVKYLLNDSHLAGVGDILKAVYQKYFDSETIKDYDLTEMIKSASEKVTTQKLLLVAHSQGNFYANSFYDTEAGKEGGVPAGSIAVYGVATPSGRVAGAGKWMTSDTDKVIAGIVAEAPFRTIMQPNTHIDLQNGDDTLGHNFVNVYLKYRASEIVSDIYSELDTLASNDVQIEDKPCIRTPDITLGHKVESAMFAVADPVANAGRTVVVTTATAAYDIGMFAVEKAAEVAGAIVDAGEFVFGASGEVLSQNPVIPYGSTAATAILSQNNRLSVSSDSEKEDIKVSDFSQGNLIPTNGTVSITTTSSHTADQNSKPKVAAAPTEPAKKISPLVSGPVSGRASESLNSPQSVSYPGFGGGSPASQVSTSFDNGSNTISDVDTTPPSTPVILSPSDFSSTFLNSIVTFSGTAEPGTIIESNSTSATTSVDQSGNWSLALTLGQGRNDLEFTAIDTSGNESPVLTVHIDIDSLAPSLALSVPSCDTSLSDSSCVILATSSPVSWSSTDGDLSYFLFDVDGSISTTTATSTTLSLCDNMTHEINIAAIDLSGNVSATTTQLISVYSMPVVINEVAWAGTSASSADEWIELYNRTAETLNLSSFILYAADGSPYVTLSGTIAPNGYYLIERKNTGETNEMTESSVVDVPADLWVSFGSGLNNNGEDLYLSLVRSGATTTIDRLSMTSSWWGGDSSSYLTLERIDPDVSGRVGSNWQTALGGDIKNGRDSLSSAIGGTPKMRNSLNYLVDYSGIVSSNKTLFAAHSPYFVPDTGLTIQNGMTVTIEPGVVIKFAPSSSMGSRGITVNGSIISSGTAQNPVVFTAIDDDDYGGDVNANGSTTISNWNRIDIAGAGSTFSHTIFRYGGGTPAGPVSAMITIDGTSATFDNDIFAFAPNGITLGNSGTSITNSHFSNINFYPSSSAAIYISNGSLATISNTTFTDNAYGIKVTNSPGAVITANTFSGQSHFPILVTNSVPTISNNSGSGNGTNGIALIGHATHANATTTLRLNDLAYVLDGDVDVVSNSALAFEDGVVVKGFGGTILGEVGKLIVRTNALLYHDGTNAGSVILTSLFDDTYGGDTDNSGTSARPGDWHGIDVENGGRTSLSGFTMRYAGTNNIYGGGRPAVLFKDGAGDSLLANGLVEENNQAGIIFENAGSLAMHDMVIGNQVAPASSFIALALQNAIANMAAIVFRNNTIDISAAVGNTNVSCVGCGSPFTDPIGLLP